MSVLANALHSMVPVHAAPAVSQAHPSIAAQLACVCRLAQPPLEVPEQLSVDTQPLAEAHIEFESSAHAVGTPEHTGAPAAPALGAPATGSATYPATPAVLAEPAAPVAPPVAIPPPLAPEPPTLVLLPAAAPPMPVTFAFPPVAFGFPALPPLPTSLDGPPSSLPQPPSALIEMIEKPKRPRVSLRIAIAMLLLYLALWLSGEDPAAPSTCNRVSDSTSTTLSAGGSRVQQRPIALCADSILVTTSVERSWSERHTGQSKAFTDRRTLGLSHAAWLPSSNSWALEELLPSSSRFQTQPLDASVFVTTRNAVPSNSTRYDVRVAPAAPLRPSIWRCFSCAAAYVNLALPQRLLVCSSR